MDGRVQTQYPRKNWSSFMLLNCEKLSMWTKASVENQPAKWLHRFEPIPDERIGDIPRQWNVLDHYDADTKLIHYTEGGPWFENCQDVPFSDFWLNEYEDWQNNGEHVAIASAPTTSNENKKRRAGLLEEYDTPAGIELPDTEIVIGLEV